MCVPGSRTQSTPQESCDDQTEDPKKENHMKRKLNRTNNKSHWKSERAHSRRRQNIPANQEEEASESETAADDSIALTLAKPKKPKGIITSEEALVEFDRLNATGTGIAYYADEPDPKHPQVLCSVVGDTIRNRLIIVVRHRRSRRRFATVIQYSGSRPIEIQRFGLNYETAAVIEASAIVVKVLGQLIDQHQVDLL
jgi:hypothetical protein